MPFPVATPDPQTPVGQHVQLMPSWRLLERGSLAIVYGVIALLFVPWIAFLWFSQPQHGTEHNAALLAGGLLVMLAVSTLFTGFLYISSSRTAIVGAVFAGSLSFAILWFRFTAQPTRVPALTESMRLIALLLPIALLLWSARRWLRELGVTVQVRFGLWIGYLIAAVLVSVGAFQLASVAATTDPEHHLRLVWTGLDVIELLGLAWTGWCLGAGSRLVVFAAPFTAAFLVSDAWTNVIATAGDGRLAALGMAVIELSLASLSIWVAAAFCRPGRRQQPSLKSL